MDEKSQQFSPRSIVLAPRILSRFVYATTTSTWHGQVAAACSGMLHVFP